MYVGAQDAGLGNALLGVGALPLRGLLVAVLRAEVGDHEVAGVDTGDIAVVAGLQDTVGLVVTELAEDTEFIVVVDVAAGSKDIVGGVVEDHQLGVVDTVC